MRTDGQTNMTKQIVSFRNFVNAPKRLYQGYINMEVTKSFIEQRKAFTLVTCIIEHKKSEFGLSAKHNSKLW